MSISGTLRRGFPTFFRSAYLVSALCTAGCVPSSPITYLDWGLDQHSYSSTQRDGSSQKASSSSSQIHSLNCNNASGFDWPLKGSLIRQFAGGAKNSPSPGIDILGTGIGPVMAAWDGTVTYADDLKGYGKVVLIEHCEGLIGVYANLSDLAVQRGSRVQKGQNLGSLLIDEAVGGAVLHFELRENKLPVDPMRHLKSTNVVVANPKNGMP